MSEALLKDALRLRRAGKLSEAAALYGQVLSAEPEHFEALHALGILNYQSGRLEDAERLIRAAICDQSPCRRCRITTTLVCCKG